MGTIAESFILKGEKRGEICGQKRGQIMALNQVAVRMFQNGFDLTTIQDITGLSKAQLNQLRNQQNN